MQVKDPIGIRLVRIAGIYMLIGLGAGLYVAISKDFALMSVHSHLALVGWATMAIAGLVYRAWPVLAEGRLARWHFWLHNGGLPVMMVSLAFKAYGHTGAEPMVGVGSIVVLLGLLLFVVNLFRSPDTGV